MCATFSHLRRTTFTVDELLNHGTSFPSQDVSSSAALCRRSLLLQHYMGQYCPHLSLIGGTTNSGSTSPSLRIPAHEANPFTDLSGVYSCSDGTHCMYAHSSMEFYYHFENYKRDRCISCDHFFLYPSFLVEDVIGSRLLGENEKGAGSSNEFKLTFERAVQLQRCPFYHTNAEREAWENFRHCFGSWNPSSQPLPSNTERQLFGRHEFYAQLRSKFDSIAHSVFLRLTSENLKSGGSSAASSLTQSSFSIVGAQLGIDHTSSGWVIDSSKPTTPPSNRVYMLEMNCLTISCLVGASSTHAALCFLTLSNLLCWSDVTAEATAAIPKEEEEALFLKLVEFPSADPTNPHVRLNPLATLSRPQRILLRELLTRPIQGRQKSQEEDLKLETVLSKFLSFVDIFFASGESLQSILWLFHNDLCEAERRLQEIGGWLLNCASTSSPSVGDASPSSVSPQRCVTLFPLLHPFCSNHPTQHVNPHPYFIYVFHVAMFLKYGSPATAKTGGDSRWTQSPKLSQDPTTGKFFLSAPQTAPPSPPLPCLQELDDVFLMCLAHHLSERGWIYKNRLVLDKVKT